MALNLEIFWIFFRISFLSFGGVFGVLPELERWIVVEKQWMSSQQFIQSYILGQFVPGPNMAMCPLIGYWVNGWGGFTAGFLGIYIPPLLIMAGAFWLYKRTKHLAWVGRTERAWRPVVLGLTLASALKLWWSILNTDQVVASAVMSLALLVAGSWALRNKKITTMPLIFGTGLIWWFFERLTQKL
jgi:chromate transporter